MSAHRDPGGARFVRDWRRNAARLSAHGLYRPSDEHDACGVGLVAAIDGRPRRAVVEAGIEALKSVWHRGAVDADGMTGDGAGIHVQIPQEFFKEHVRRTGHVPLEGRMAVGMVFLPRTDLAAQYRRAGLSSSRPFTIRSTTFSSFLRRLATIMALRRITSRSALTALPRRPPTARE